ncbi:MAG: septal ring lytic transglycosylase RlpA family protein [Pseudomonadota bacterium]
MISPYLTRLALRASLSIRHVTRVAVMAFLAVSLTSCAEIELGSHLWKETPGYGQSGNFKVGKPYTIDGKTYVPEERYNHSESGIASWYGPGFHGKRTANGEMYNSGELTAAHRTLQMPSLARVTNLENGRSIVVRINDRGPFSRGRVMDVSERAAELLGFKNKGTARIKIDVLADESRQIASAAKAGRDVKGYEVALNSRTADTPRAVPVTAVSAEPVPGPAGGSVIAAVETTGRLPEDEHPPPGGYPGGTPQAGAIRGHMTQGLFYPDQTVSMKPVSPTDLYVQVGAFGDSGNAQRAEERLSGFGNAFVMPVQAAGKTLYRVRIGPVATVDQADILLGRVVDTGFRDAILIVDQH